MSHVTGPFAALGRSDHNLPYQLTSCIGRHVKPIELRCLINERRLVTLIETQRTGKIPG
jgi:hypothetical protein